jgi:hypothetical protein
MVKTQGVSFHFFYKLSIMDLSFFYVMIYLNEMYDILSFMIYIFTMEVSLY